MTRAGKPILSMAERVNRVPTPVTDPDLVTANRRKLVDAAIRLFRDQGFHATSVADVAKAARMSVGTVYLYIETKSDLLLLIFSDVVQIYEERIFFLRSIPGSPWDCLKSAIFEYYTVLDMHHDRTEIMYHEFGSLDPSTRKYVSRVEEELTEVVRTFIDQGISNGDFVKVDPELMAENILWLGHMWALNRGHVRKTMSLDIYIERQTANVGRLLGVKQSLLQ